MLRAIPIMLLAMALIPAGDAAGKLMFNTHGVLPGFVAWLRFVVGAVLLIAITRGKAIEASAFRNPWVLFRGALIAVTIFTILSGIQTVSLSTAFAAFFVGPMVSYLLSVLLLKEQVTWTRTGLLLLGFVGVLLVVRPDAGLSVGAGLAALAGVFYGGYLTASRWLAGKVAGDAMLMVQLTVGAVLLTPFGLSALPETWPPGLWGLIALSGAFSMLGNLFLLQAYRMAEATRLAPFVYFQLVAATVFSIWIFGDWPDAIGFGGLALLMLSGFATLALPNRRGA